MEQILPSFFLQTIKYFSSYECDNPIPFEVGSIITKNLYDIANNVKRKLSLSLTIYTKDYECFNRNLENRRDRIESNNLLEKSIKYIEKLDDYNDDVAISILRISLNDAEFKQRHIMHMIDYSASLGNINICKLLYKIFGIEALTFPNQYGLTALHRSCHIDNVTAIKTLLETINKEDIWAYINIPGSNMNESPLFRAATSGSADSISLLLDASGEQACNYIMNDNNNRSSSLFYACCMNGHLEVVKLLLETVGDKNILPLILLHNENAFIGAASNGQTDIVDYLLEKIGDGKMELMKIKAYGITALSMASFNGCFYVIKTIIKHAGNRVNELDLHDAVRQTYTNKNIEIEKYLNDILKNGVWSNNLYM